MELFNRRMAWIAIIGALGVIVAQIIFRPPWRDEYWALYFSAPDMGLTTAVDERMSADVHPPFYFIVMHYWLQLLDNELFARFFNLVLMAGAFAAGWAWRGEKARQTALYLFLCVTSFWLIFFAAEIRMMAALFLTCMLSVLAARNAQGDAGVRIGWLAAFCAIGMATASMHFFGTLWTGAFGLCLGLSFLLRGQVVGFVAAGIATLVALLPALLWILLVRPDQNSGAPDVLPPVLDNLNDGLEQFLRGILKAFIANWPSWIAGILGLGVLFKSGAARFEKTLLAAVLLSVAIAFAIHLSVVALIKERAFIVIIPGILYLLASGIVALQPGQTKARRIAGWIPLMAIIALPLFSTEYFKDREEYNRVTAFISGYEACEGAPILMYERPSGQGADYSSFYARRVTRRAFDGEGLNLKPMTEPAIAEAEAGWSSSSCPVRAIALVLPRGNGRRQREMREEMRANGLPLDEWTERRFGEGRSIVFVTGAEAPASGQP
ncbi:hypothetical protein WNY37_14770 [Henriciella sp. AS95]|uniref:hypothetical protein n=1 Tax=Henriciella sp. AS95 TaxID=3135782 RepID=UPI00316CF213